MEVMPVTDEFPRTRITCTSPLVAGGCTLFTRESGDGEGGHMSTTGRGEVRAGKSGGLRKSSPALSKPVKPDEWLAKVVGADELPRPEVVKKLWDYIKSEGLQDRDDRRMINADDKLRPIFDGKAQVNMFEMTKLVSKHLS
jgi:upstream activation factor subunit UAF30